MMIANVSPASDQFDETLNTLKYADRAKRIRTKEAKSMLNSSRKRLLGSHVARRRVRRRVRRRRQRARRRRR